MSDKNMSVKLLSIKNGFQEYTDVKFIKIKSKDYNLLIMQDYLPIIGEIEGDVKIELVSSAIELINIKGYFMNKKNQFNLFIKDEEEDD